MENNIKEKIAKLKVKIEEEEKTLKADKEEYTKLYDRLYSSCDHFKAIAHIEEDSREGRLYFSYKCVKCGLDEMFCDWPYNTMDEEMMIPYLEKYGCRIPGFQSKTDFDYKKIRNIYQSVIEENPNITNEELESILVAKENEEKAKKAEENGIQRTRIQ